MISTQIAKTSTGKPLNLGEMLSLRRKKVRPQSRKRGIKTSKTNLLEHLARLSCGLKIGNRKKMFGEKDYNGFLA